MADLSAYDDPEDKFSYELTPAPYSRLAETINDVTKTTRRVKNRIITIKDVSVAHTQQLIEDVKDLKNHPKTLARFCVWAAVPAAVFLRTRSLGSPAVKRLGYPLLAFGASSAVCYPGPTWNLTKAGGKQTLVFDIRGRYIHDYKKLDDD